MAFISRILISLGLGVFLFASFVAIVPLGFRIFSEGMFSLLGLFMLVLYIFDYATYFLAT